MLNYRAKLASLVAGHAGVNLYREKLAQIALGDFPGHPFRGNQYTAGDGGKGGGAVTRSGSIGPAYAKLLDQVRQPDGGFTVHTLSGDIPKTGYALSLHKDREQIVPMKELKLADLARFAVKNADLLSRKDHYFGAWHNPQDDKVYFDVSQVVHNAAEAERLGRAADQLAYFDLGEGKSVDIPKKAA